MSDPVPTPAALPEAQVFIFPEAEIVRRPAAVRAGQVAITHHGVTRIYDTPQDLWAAVLVECAPELEAAERGRALRRLRRTMAAIRRRRGRTLLRFGPDLVLAAGLALLSGAMMAAVLLAGWGL